jgi:hypothetical protein
VGPHREAWTRVKAEQRATRDGCGAGGWGERAAQPGKNMVAIGGRPALQNNFHALGGGADARIIVAGFGHDSVQADVIVIGVVMIED